MRLPNPLTRKQPITDFDRSEIVWGVRRRIGFGDMDDPGAHAGLPRHAFVAGNDDVAVCGYRAVGWRRRRAVPLAVATESNPACPRCVSVVGDAGTAVAPALAELISRLELAPVPEPVPEPVVHMPRKVAVRARRRASGAARRAAA